MLSREETYRMAKLCYGLEDFATSFRYMEDLVISVRGELSPPEREILLSAGDWLIDLLMEKIRMLSPMLLLEPTDAPVADYHARLVFEVRMLCYRYLDILQKVIIVTTDMLSLVMYYWARGDCYKFIVETMKGDNSKLSEFQNYIRLTSEAYTRALDEARILVKSNPEETKTLMVLAHRLVLFYCVVAEQYGDAKKIALQTLSDVRPKNVFSFVMNIKSYMECSDRRTQLKLLVDYCNSKLNQN